MMDVSLGVVLDAARKKAPLVHCVTNYVTAHEVANAILASGGRPIMADDPAEAVEIASAADALLLNVGTPCRRTAEAMRLAGRKAMELGRPIVLDPVGAGASRLRTETSRALVSELHPAVIRGNISEVLALAQGVGATRGVDAAAADAVTEANLAQKALFARRVARETGAVMAISGVLDLVADADTCVVLRNGCARMGGVTGCGCMLTGLVAVFAAAFPESSLAATVAAVAAMGVAGEIAEARLRPDEGHATFGLRIVDALSLLDGKTLEKGARCEFL